MLIRGYMRVAMATRTAVIIASTAQSKPNPNVLVCPASISARRAATSHAGGLAREITCRQPGMMLIGEMALPAKKIGIVKRGLARAVLPNQAENLPVADLNRRAPFEIARPCPKRVAEFRLRAH